MPTYLDEGHHQHGSEGEDGREGWGAVAACGNAFQLQGDDKQQLADDEGGNLGAVEHEQSPKRSLEDKNFIYLEFHLFIIYVQWTSQKSANLKINFTNTWKENWRTTR